MRHVVRDADDGVIDRQYLLCPERSRILVRLFELAAQGIADANIARRLNAEGYRTRGGIAWTRRRVQDTVTNPWYAGRVARGRSAAGKPTEWKDATHPPLVDPAVYDRIQSLRTSRDTAKGSNRKPGRPYSRHALAGLATCGRCCERMIPQISPYRRKDGTQRRTYRDHHVHHGTGLCDQPTIDAEAVDRAVVSHLRGFFIDFDGWIQAVAARSTSDRDTIMRTIDEETDTLADAERRAAKLAADFACYSVDNDQVMARAAATALDAETTNAEQARHRVNRLRAALDALRDEPPTDALLDHFNRLSAAVRGRLDASGSLAEVNEELRRLFHCFDLDTTEDGIRCIPVMAEGVSAWFSWHNSGMEWGRIYRPANIDPEPIPTLITGREGDPFTQLTNSQA